MKSSVFLLCSFFVLFSCHAALSKKYFRENVQNYFTPYFEPDFFRSLSGKNQTVESVGKLTTALLHDIYFRTGKSFNVALSPVSIWVILAMLLEGAGGKTESELKSKLQLSYSAHEEGNRILRNGYKEMLNFNPAGSSQTEFKLVNFVISDKAKVINPEYKNIIRQHYDGRYYEVDSRNTDQIVRSINMWASQITQNKISVLVSQDLLSNLQLVIGNAAYFRSKWKYPFDPAMTISMPFKDEYERPLRNVPMMNQIAVLPYAYNSQLESEILEIPYADGLTSMIVILPRERISLATVLYKMSRMSLNEIIPKNFAEETIQFSIPKFRITNKVYLNEVLKQDLRSVFSSQHAEFPHIGRNIFVSKITHKAEIENTEEGTAASAVTNVHFAYKSSSIIFRANRPFIYLVNEINTKTVLFAGIYSNPFNST